MVRLSDKTQIQKSYPIGQSIPSDFDLSDFEATIRDKGIDVILEKAHLCPCKSEESTHRNICQNCRGSGWIFVNPTKTKMLIQSIQLDGKLKEAALREWGLVDMGTVKITALNSDKLSYMDKIIISDATSESSELLFPVLTQDLNGDSESDSGLEGQLFAFTKYIIKNIVYVGLFRSETQTLLKLEETTDYTFENNILKLGAQYDSLDSPCVTIRYGHAPVVHVVDLLREAMTSTVKTISQGQNKIMLPILALGKRAHLIKDVENFYGTRLLDNSWLPSVCESEDMTSFQRQLRYTPTQTIYNLLTDTQRAEMEVIVNA